VTVLPDLRCLAILVLNRETDEVSLDPTNKCDLVLLGMTIVLAYEPQLAHYESGKAKRTQSRVDINSTVAAADRVLVYGALVPVQWLPHVGNTLFVMEAAGGCDEDRGGRFDALVTPKVIHFTYIPGVMCPRDEAILEYKCRGSRIPASDVLG
jgi:hypothetical protein